MKSVRWHWPVIALSGLLCGPIAGAADEEGLTSLEQLGQRIYTRGEGIAGHEILAVLGEGGTKVPASMMPCSSCHGSDGKGRAEGGVSPSDITWSALTRPYAASTPSGRQPPPYDERLAKRAVTMGLDSAGEPLHIAMPRYELTHEEAAGLVAYLQRLDLMQDPGVSADFLRLGVVLPPSAPGPAQASLGLAIRSVLEAAAARVNRRGGIYNRRLELRFLELAASPAEAVTRFLEEEEIFALVACYLVGVEAEVAGLLDRLEVPLVGPFVAYPQLEFPLNPQIFYLRTGLPQQASVLADFAGSLGQGGTDHRGLVVHPKTGDWRAVAQAILERLQRQDGVWTRLESRTFSRQHLATMGPLVQEAHESAVDMVFFLGSDSETSAFLQAAGTIGWHPQILLLGELSGNGALHAPAAHRDRIFLSFPSLASDTSPAGFASFVELRQKHGPLTEHHLASQLRALAAFELLVDALEQSGRDIGRERLVASLEGLYQHATPWTRPLSFGPNRRIGANGAYIVVPDFVNGSLMGASQWRSLDD